MYITPRQYAAAYESILSSARRSSSSGAGASSSPILIIPAMDPDAVFATRILTALLERDCLSYRLSPVAGWKELSRVIQSQRWYRPPTDRMDEDGQDEGEGEEEQEEAGEGGTRVVILINVGASTDLSSFLRIPPGVTAHLIDSHRPYALENLFSTADGASPTVIDASSLHQAPLDAGQGRIVVWDDGDVAEDMDAEKEAFLALEYEPDSDSEEERSDASDDDDERAFQAARRRQRLDSPSSDEASSDDDGGEEDEDGEPRERKRKKKRRREEEEAEKMLSKRERAKHLARLKKYYSGGASHGQSVAGVMYVLAEGRALQDNDLLWLAILGLTYQFTASLIDRDRYDTYVVTYQREVARINFTHPIPTTTNFANDDFLPPVQPRAGLTADGEPGPSGADDRNIRPSEELRFMLFRHWNLYDSMFHSGYVAGKLKLWRERGRRNLQGMLAKMGFSLQQCQQTYAHMDMDLKRTLRRKVDSLAPEYGLFDLCFPSFVRTFGYRSILSASDCVEAVAALLEVANGVRLDFSSPATNGMGGIAGATGLGQGDGIGQGGRFWEGGGKSSGRWKGEAEKENRDPTTAAGATGVQMTSMTQAAKKAAREEEWWVSNFWLAWDALSTDTTLLRSALPLSMALHRSVIRQGTSLLDKQAIKTLRSFRLAVIREGPDLGVFAHPATLARLGLWLVDAVRDLILGGQPAGGAQGQAGKRPKALPFVVASLDEEKDTFWVVGVTGAVEYGDVRKNKFGQAFQAAAELSNARARHDRFEESACEVRKDDLMAFVEKLHLAL